MTDNGYHNLKISFLNLIVAIFISPSLQVTSVSVHDSSLEFQRVLFPNFFHPYMRRYIIPVVWDILWYLTGINKKLFLKMQWNVIFKNSCPLKMVVTFWIISSHLKSYFKSYFTLSLCCKLVFVYYFFFFLCRCYQHSIEYLGMLKNAFLAKYENIIISI